LYLLLVVVTRCALSVYDKTYPLRAMPTSSILLM